MAEVAGGESDPDEEEDDCFRTGIKLNPFLEELTAWFDFTPKFILGWVDNKEADPLLLLNFPLLVLPFELEEDEPTPLLPPPLFLFLSLLEPRRNEAFCIKLPGLFPCPKLLLRPGAAAMAETIALAGCAKS